ncbi:MAG: SDR family oxidoreductase [Candidatus Eremiobacteraeota bacterium]|nr:SDR family oxidoreductase [Candidatus Eremiobacteraeota bacterium]
MTKKIAITGTSRGLGYALSSRFTELGHQVFGGGRTDVSLLEEPPAGKYVALDVTDGNSQSSWWDALVSEFQGLPDIVIANAAVINESAPLWEVPEQEFRKVVDVNINGVYLTFKQFLDRWMSGEKKDAVLIAVSSGWGRSTSPEVAPYCTTKWAVEGMVGALSQELPPGLAAMALNPGIIDTEMLRSCFGTSASHYWAPQEWARSAADQILSFGLSNNGESATIIERN